MMLISLLFVGCSTVPQKDVSRLSRAAKAYDVIKVDMTEEEAMQTLGPPTKTAGNQISWLTRFNRTNYESLKLTIDENNKIEKTVRKHVQRSGGAFDHSHSETFSRSYYD